MKDLSLEEMERVQRALRKRFISAADSDVLEVGFGVPYKDGTPEPERGFAAIFTVKKKKKPRGRAPLPDTVSVRIKRDSSYATISLPTDVRESREVKPTGATVRTGLERATTGLVVSWRIAGSSEDRWGLITVAHAMAGISIGGSVTIEPESGTTLTGTLLWKSKLNSGRDTAVINVSQQGLRDGNLLKAGQEGGRILTRSPVDVVADANPSVHRPGTSLGPSSQVRFRVEEYYPNTDRVAGLGRINGVIRVKAERNDAFPIGTSGSAWIVENQPAAIQYGGVDDDGYGQIAAGALADVIDALVDQFNVRAASFRIVTVF